MREIVHELYSEEQVNERIGELAEQINRDYAGKELRVIGILKGGVFFFTELVKRLDIPVTIDFMAASSYGDGTESSGQLEILKDLDDVVDGIHCLIVEDIVDSGNTLRMIQKMIAARNPASVEICALLDKPERRTAEVSVAYTGFTVPDQFLVGYGLDYAQRYRNLPYIGVIEFVEE